MKRSYQNFLKAATKGGIRNFIDSSLSDSQIMIQDPKLVAAKIYSIKSMGTQNCQILSDYDYTLTKEIYHDGLKADSSFKAIQDSTILPLSLKMHTKTLYKKYSPIERDPLIEPTIKAIHMHNWWESNLEAISKLNLRKVDYDQIVIESRILFRDGIKEFMDLSHRFQIPLYIVSGGIVEIIEASFTAMLHNGELSSDSSKKCWENMGIFSNTFKYHQERTFDYQKPIIHILNKQEYFYEQLGQNQRKNVIVMGDILEDVKMVNLEQHENVLKIGFLNNLEAYGHLQQEYLNTFDILITNDGSLHHVNMILHKIFDESTVYDMDKLIRTQGLELIESLFIKVQNYDDCTDQRLRLILEKAL